MSRKAIKENAIADFLADRVIKDYEPVKFDFSDEDLMAIMQIEDEPKKENCWKLYFDRASNALGHGIDVILITLNEEYCPFTARLDFDYTNNVAEYEAYAMGLQATLDKKIKKLEVYEDSALVIYQLRGEWETRDSRLLLYHKYITDMIK